MVENIWILRGRVKVSKVTRERVQRRIELANRPYVAHRRNFNVLHEARVKLARALLKGAVWMMV
jgi:hypothetical protein